MKRKTLLFTIVALMSLSGCTLTPAETIKEVTSITLNETSKTLEVDDTFQLTATVLPDDATDKTVTWSSSKEDVASVSQEGMVTALKAGNTTITATSKSTSTVKATCEITVNEKFIEVTSISLNETSMTVTEGDVFDLIATVYPNNATNSSVTWDSSDKTVATVSNGVVTTLKDGTTTITVTSNSKSSVKATCTVTVNPKDQPVTGDIIITPKGSNSNREISINKDSFTVEGTTLSSASGSKVYGTSSASDKAYRLGNSDYSGYLQFAFSAISIHSVSVSAYAYNNDTNCGLKITAGSVSKTVTVSDNEISDYEAVFDDLSNITSLKIETTAKRKRVIIKSISIVTSVAEPVYPESITLADAEVGIGSTTQLVPVFVPADTNQKDLTWDSSNKEVATVSSNGLVRGIKAGTTTITAVGKNENNQDVTATCTVTVKTIAVTDVTLSETTLNVTVGKEKTLTPTVLPTNATNKNVTWKSENTSIATVVNGVVKGISTGETIVSVITEDGNKTANCLINVSEQQIDDWTLLFYICGSNLESASRYQGGGCATDDINEILSQRSIQPDSVNIVVETGGAKKWYTSNVEADKINRFEINNTSNSMIKISSLDKANMGDPSTLQSFLEWGIANYPAEKYGLFMWNHGGAMDGCCFDELYSDDGLFADEVDQAVTAAKTTLGISEKLEFIAYDACLMAVQDVAEWNSHNFNYMLSSQESEWSGGYAYDAWLPTLYENPSSISTVTLLSKIGDTFLDYFEGQGYYDQTQSVYDLSKMAAYKDAWETMTESLSTIITNSSKWSSFTTLVNQAKKFGQDDSTSGYNNGYIFDVFDVKGALTKVKGNSTFSSLSAEIDNVLALFDQVVVYERHGSKMSGSNGMCLFCPISGYNQKTTIVYQGKTYLPNYSADRTNFKKWQALCAQYGTWYS